MHVERRRCGTADSNAVIKGQEGPLEVVHPAPVKPAKHRLCCGQQGRDCVKRIAALLLTLGLTLSVVALLPASADGQCGPIRYRVYDNANYGTPVAYLCFNEPDLSRVAYGGLPWENFNNNISSLRIDVSSVAFYDQVNYGTFLKSYASSTTYVGATLNDRFSSAYNSFNP